MKSAVMILLLSVPLLGCHIEPTAALSLAAARGDLPAVQRLLASGTPADQRDEYAYTPLMWAAWYGRTDVARRLLDAGAEMRAAVFIEMEVCRCAHCK
ncbi:MAG TPA: ankyrin repeat domain-containing protein [Thermoanaerobaculia bacterium]|nr:ankyrin repeat domain-containing protein [Thermoanaerobaculia bacterium]